MAEPLRARNGSLRLGLLPVSDSPGDVVSAGFPSSLSSSYLATEGKRGEQGALCSNSHISKVHVPTALWSHSSMFPKPMYPQLHLSKVHVPTALGFQSPCSQSSCLQSHVSTALGFQSPCCYGHVSKVHVPTSLAFQSPCSHISRFPKPMFPQSCFQSQCSHISSFPKSMFP